MLGNSLLCQFNVTPSALIVTEDGTHLALCYLEKTAACRLSHTLKIFKDNVLLSSVDYNVNAYIEAKLTDTEVGAIVKALNNYGAAARAYIDSFE